MSKFTWTIKDKTIYLIIKENINIEEILPIILLSIKRIILSLGEKKVKKFKELRIILNNSEAILGERYFKHILEYTLAIRNSEELICKSRINDDVKCIIRSIFSIPNGLIYIDPPSAVNMLRKWSAKHIFFKKIFKFLRKCEYIKDQGYLLEYLRTKLAERNDGLIKNVSEMDEIHELVDEYDVGPYIVMIIDREDEDEYEYKVMLKKPISSIVSQIDMHIEKVTYSWALNTNLHDMNLDAILNHVRNYVKTFLNSNYNFSSSFIEELATFFTFKILGLSNIAPLLLDDEVEEFYVDKPGLRVYLDHAKWGRCISNIRLDEKDIEAFLTHVRLESKQDLTCDKPSLKADIHTSMFHLRVSIDISPLVKDGMALDVRKFRLRPYTLTELIELGTISIEAAAFLLCALRHRRNIIIIGEPGSGKTTLLNALDLCAPKYWRKVYIEDTSESIPQLSYGRHQLRLKVPTYEEELWLRNRIKVNKSIEVIKLLHRSPDYVLLGELQTKEHSKAFFHALSAGIRGIATSHANAPEDIILRWTQHHDIKPSNIALLDLIVLMRRIRRMGSSRRKVVRICEIVCPQEHEINENDIILRDLFVHDGEKLVPVVNPLKCALMKRICEEEGYSLEDLFREYELFSNTLKRLALESKTDVNSLLRAFTRLYRQLDQGGILREAMSIEGGVNGVI